MSALVLRVDFRNASARPQEVPCRHEALLSESWGRMRNGELAFITPLDAPSWQRWLVFSPAARIVFFAALLVGFSILVQALVTASGWAVKTAAPLQRAVADLGMRLLPALIAYVILVKLLERRRVRELSVLDLPTFGVAGLVTGAVLFSGFVGTAIVWVKRAEIHKRLMLLAMIPLMHAAFARLFAAAFAPADAKGPPPVFVSVPPGLMMDLLIVAAMVYDWRTRGRPHPVYWIGGALLLADQTLAVPLSATSTWMAIATWVQSLAG